MPKFLLAGGAAAAAALVGYSSSLPPVRPARVTVPAPTPSATPIVFPLPSPDGYTDPATGLHVTQCPGDLIWHPDTHACSFTVAP